MDVFAVEAFAASWIEIQKVRDSQAGTRSKPLRLRGLKFPCQKNWNHYYHVEAFAASWIEIYYVLMVI